MRRVLLLIAFCGSVFANAQQVKVTKNEPLLKGVVSEAYYPVLSADGNTMLFTGINNKGLKVYDFRNDVVTTITDGEQAGMDARVTNDGDVYFTKQTYKGRLRYESVEKYDASTKKIATVKAEERGYMLPIVSEDEVSVVRDGKMQRLTTKKMHGTEVYTSGSVLVINTNGKEIRVSPAGETAGYLWASVSPNGQNIVFFAAGKGVYVTNLKGEVLATLGNYEMPQWYGNNYVVAQNAKDDGHQYISSQLMLLKADGSFKKELTSPTSMSMQPSVARDSKRIVYSTIDGRLYEMELTIAE